MERLGGSIGFSIFLFCLGMFLAFPEIDLWIAESLYQPGTGFFLADAAPVRWVYEVFARMGAVIVLGLAGFWLWRRWLRHDNSPGWQRRVLYLVVVLAMGPGLVVNAVFKADSGRARPHQVEQFGGESHFTGFGMPARECQRNCSSVSGHAAVAFYFIAFAWALGSRAWLVVGLMVGAVVGVGRMMQGGHFLSDILFAFWAVYFVAYLAAGWLLGNEDPRPDLSHSSRK